MNTAITCEWFAPKDQPCPGRKRTVKSRASFVEAAVSAANAAMQAGDTPATTGSFRLLAQKMARIGDQFCHCVRLGRIVIAANVTVSIYQHHACAVHRRPRFFATV